VPFGITVDFETIEGDGTVTVRNRDTTEQKRLSVEQAIAVIEEEINP
jgi:glycyl-tRNA synthetase